MKKTISFILSLGLVIGTGIFAFGANGEPQLLQTNKQSVTAESEYSVPSNSASNVQRSVEEKATVYMTTEITPEALLEIYDALGVELTGDNIAVKLSTGEPPASNYLRPELIQDLVWEVDGTIVECNTTYGGSRGETAMHYQVAEDHGFTEIAEVDIMDADGSLIIPVEGGTRLKENYVGAHFAEYDGFLVLSHFKGHAMAGMGGAIKNISIGIASKEGKCLIHTAGASHTSPWGGETSAFQESMAEAGKSVVDALDGNILYINVLNNLSVDCDCSGRPAASDIHDIGILASTDPVALDQASVDLVYAAEGNRALVNRMESLNAIHVLEHGEEIGLGTRSYELVDINEVVSDPVDKTALADALENVIPESEKDNYTEESWSTYAEVIVAANAVNDKEDATQEEVDAAIIALEDAKKALVEKPDVDLSVLLDMIDEAETLNSADYTKESWSVFEAALVAAKTVLDDEEVTKAEVIAAQEQLSDAIEGLTLIQIVLPYKDVAETDWFYGAVEYTYLEGLMTGMDASHFGPYGSLSRAQFALILYRMEGSPETTGENSFKDIVGDEWYAKAVLWAAENGIVTGYVGGNFGPADMITREQMAVMMYRYANYLKEDTSEKGSYSEFADAEKVSVFAKEAMQWAVGEGIITGKEGGTIIDPQGNTARAECAVIIQRYTQR